MPLIKRICKNCNKEFGIDRWRLKDPTRGTFCSQKCSRLYHVGENHGSFGIKRPDVGGSNNHWWKSGKPNCIECGKQIVAYTAKRCQSCNLHFHSGENSYHWKGGKTKLDKLERQKFRVEIQKLVFKRDNYTCQLCRTRGGILQVDHIQPWAEYVELRFKMENCRTLCMKCHYEITWKKPMSESIKTWGQRLKEMEYIN